MDVAIPLYDGFTALDAIGPYEVLSRLPGCTVTFCSAVRGEVRSDRRSLGVTADAALDDIASPDVVVVPGGPGSREAMVDHTLLEWVRGVHEHSQWTTSVCTGSLVLGGAGLLNGVRATGHWATKEILASTGALPVDDRVVIEGKVITAAGVTAGIDMALRLAAILADEDLAQAIQLELEYDPQPPFSSGSPKTAPARVMERYWTLG